MTIADCREGRGQDDALDAGVARGPQHSQRTVDGRPDQVVLVLGLGEREGGGNVLDIVASGDCLGPASILVEIGGGEGQPVEIFRPGLRERIAHRLFLGQRPHRRAHIVPRLEQLQDDVPADKARSTRDQNDAHRSPSVL